MFDYESDYESYYERTEIEEALNEFRDGIYKMLNKDIAETLENQSDKIIRLEEQLKTKSEKISKLTTDVRKAKEDGKKEQKKDWLGDIKYGDVIYIVTNSSKKRECPFCENGKINVKSGEKIECPKCYGRGIETYWENEILEKKIKKVQITVENSAYGTRREGRWYKVDGSDIDVVVYKNIEDAKIELDRRNKNKK